MKRILKINILIIIILFLLTTVCQALNATVFTDVPTVRIGEEIKLTITFDEKVVATNFDINYDNEAFEFIQGDNLYAAEKDGKIVCIFADSTLVGKDTFSITFKSISEKSEALFSIDNAKVRVNGQETSSEGSEVNGLYSIKEVEVIKEDNTDDDNSTDDKENNIEGKKTESYSNTITNKNNNTQAEKVIPKAGFNYTIFIAIIIAIVFCAISKIKLNNISKILPVIIFASILWINSSVFASNEDIVVKEYNNLIENEKVFAVMLPNNTKNLYITATELEEIIKERFNYTVTSITKDEKTTSLSSSNKVNTGAQININGEKYVALIYGDANGDGTICDIDDLIVIIKDFLGIKRISGEYKIAADLANEDNLNVLDADDLIQMIRMYLGRLKGDLVQVLPNENEVILNIEDYSNVTIGGGHSWKYNIYSDGTVNGERWTSGSVLGFVSEKTKEYTVTLTSEELEFLKNIENKYVKGIIPENIITNINIENKNGTEIYTTMLTIPDFNTLKSIIEKITEFREEIKLYYNDNNCKRSDTFDDTTYSIDIYSKKIVYNRKIGGFLTYKLDILNQTEKVLTDEQIIKIKELYKKIKENSSKYTIKPTDIVNIYYKTYVGNIGECYIYEKEDIQIIDSIISNMKELEGLEATIINCTSQACTTLLEMDDGTKKTIELDEKGYKFIETSDGYYMVITMGLKTGTENRIIVEDININNNQITVFAKEKIQTEIVSDVIEYPYSLIKFNKKPGKITLDVIDGEDYKEIIEKVDPQRNPYIDYKPVIYLYPQKETEVTVKVGKPEKLTCTYPKYVEGWKVTAKPSGDLIDCKTGRNLYCLYWEGINTVKSNLTEGFIVKGEDISKFLEEKLEILGLNQKETNEFIIYWLPQLEKNNYNFIRFQTTKEINENMPLEVLPIPDTIIRVMMEWKALENPINIKEQKLEKMARSGFSVIEWGGTEIK